MEKWIGAAICQGAPGAYFKSEEDLKAVLASRMQLKFENFVALVKSFFCWDNL